MTDAPDEDYARPSESHPDGGRSRTANNGGDPNLDQPGEMGIREPEAGTEVDDD